MTRSLAAFLIVLMATSSAVAQGGDSGDSGDSGDVGETIPEPEEPPVDDRPWATGISKQAQSRALAEFEAGNDAYAKESFSQALQHYQRALQSWDHPSIRFNMSETQIHLGQTLKAYESLLAALRFGQAGLSKNLYQRAITNRKLLEGQLATVEVSCTLEGTEVTINGEPLVTCPGTERRIILPGRHAVVAKREGYLTRTWTLSLFPGKVETLAVELETIEEVVRFESRWATWKPWVVAGAGALVAASGGLFMLQANSRFASYRDEVSLQCPMGCDPSELPPSTRDLESRAELEDTVGLGLAIAGGATLAAGVVLLILNRPRAVREETEPVVGVVPMVGSGQSGVGLTIEF